MVTIIVGKVNGNKNCTIVSTSKSITTTSKLEFDVSDRSKITPGEPKWANYVKGCIAYFPGKTRHHHHHQLISLGSVGMNHFKIL